MKFERTLDAKGEAISLDEARKQCRIDDTASDDVLRVYIESARNYVENWMQNALVESTYIFKFDGFQSSYEIFKPIVSITSFEYKTASNTGTYSGSLAGTDYHLDGEQGLITLNDSVMTDLYTQSNAVKITAVVGQANIGAIKGDIKLAMLLMISHWNENRENSSVVQLNKIPTGSADLLATYRAHSL